MGKKYTPRRDRWGRFAPKRRNVPLKPYAKPARDRKTGKFRAKRVGGKPHHWRIYRGMTGKPVKVNTYGYYMVVRALIPGGWNMSGYPNLAWITDAPEESMHMVIWRTRVRENLYTLTESEEMETLAAVMGEGKELSKSKLAYGEAMEQEIIVLSTELRVLTAPHESFQVEVWPGITPPKWLRNVK